MTAEASFARAPARRRTRLLAAIPLRPVEGWLSLVSGAVMAVMVAFSFQNSGWTTKVPGVDTNFLPYLALAGFAIGVAGAKVGWGRWRTHFVGATLGGLLIPLIVGGVVIGPGVEWDPQGLALRLSAAYGVARHVWTDFVILSRQYTTEYAYYHLVFSAVIWGAGLLAGFTVFGHRRPLDAVVVLGLVLLANMALTALDPTGQLIILVIFSAAALLLLIRTHVFEEEVTWTRRRIGDPGTIGDLYLTAGAQFVIVAVLGSILLTATASSAPLQGVFKDLPQRLEGISRVLQKFAPPNGSLRGLGTVTFGDDAVTYGQWQPSNLVAFRAQFSLGEVRKFKWRGGTYSQYFLQGWDWGNTRNETTPARTILLNGDVNGDRPTETARTKVTFKVINDAFVGATILGPNMIESVDQETTVQVVGKDGWFTTAESTQAASTYNVTALVPVLQGEDAITESQLRLAGVAYPPEIASIYLNLPADAMGPDANALLASIKAAVVTPSYAEADNAYDLARTMERYLQDSSHFTYQEDIRTERNAQCVGASTVECFARIKRGYCDYYASTMAVLLRRAGVPARVAYGFLPGERAPDGTEVVGAWLSHYWVEVYFPGFGWIEFDPTGGGRGQTVAIPSGSAGPAVTKGPRPSGSAAANTSLPTIPPTTGPRDTPSNDPAPFIAIALILAVILVGLVFAAVRRTPSRPMDADKAWGSVARLASRAGLGPRPSQTVYEYAGALGDAVPAARIELTTIARAKVEVAYGKQDLGTDRLRRVAIAYQRLRFAILGLLLRRPFRRPRRPRR